MAVSLKRLRQISTQENPAGTVLAYTGNTKSFTDAAVTLAGSLITLSSHGLSTGQRVYFRNVSGTSPSGTGVSSGNYYYLIVIDINTIKLASTLENAENNIPLTISSAGSGTTLLAIVADNYLFCDGSTVSRTTYSNLFKIIGTSHGAGDGSTTFHLPDYRGRFLRGFDAGSGNDPQAGSRAASNSGGNTGLHVGTFQDYAIKDHIHPQQLFTAAGGFAGPYGGPSAGYPSNTNSPGDVWSAIGTAASYNGGSVTAYTPAANVSNQEVRPKNVNINYIIRI